jgi:very-short-patch-repair endonuclease
MIAVEYDGDDHRERPRFGNDIVRSEFIAYRGWTRIRVVAGAGRHRQPRSAGVAF